jgi:hypothetical protein
MYQERGGGRGGTPAGRVMNIISPAPRDAGTCADWVAPPCPPPGRDTVCLSSSPARSLALRPEPTRLRFTLIIHALTNPPPMRLALPVERVEPLLSSALGGWVERGPAHGVCREPHFA